MRESPYGTLKESQAALLTAVGGVDGAAANCRVGRSTLAKYADDSPENRDRHMPVDIVAALEAVASDAPVTWTLAHNKGFVLLPVKIDAGSEDLLTQDFARVADRTGVLFRDYANFLSDGVIDLHEARVLLKDIDTFLHALLTMRSNVSANISEMEDKSP